jgi:hypothetical protein
MLTKFEVKGGYEKRGFPCFYYPKIDPISCGKSFFFNVIAKFDCIVRGLSEKFKFKLI